MAFIRTQPITQQVNAIGALSQGEQLKKQRLGNKLLEAQTTPEALQENEKVRQFKLQALQAGQSEQEVNTFLTTSKRIDPFIRQLKTLQGNERIQAISSNIETFKQLGMDNEDIESLLDDNNLNNMILLNDASNQPKQTTLQQNAAFAFPGDVNKQRALVGGKISGEPKQKAGFQGLVESWKNAAEGSEEKKLFEQKLRKETAKSGGITVSPDGTVQIGGPVGLEKPINKDSQKEIISAGKSLARMARIKKNYDPTFLTYQGRAGRSLASIMDKAGINLDNKDKKMLRQYRRFSQAINTEFNSYRKLITGAAAAVKELESLKDAMISTSLGPTEFEAAYNEYAGELARTIRISNKLMREGLKPGSGQFGEELDSLYLSGGDDEIKSRGDELRQSGKSPEDVVKILEEEGYI